MELSVQRLFLSSKGLRLRYATDRTGRPQYNQTYTWCDSAHHTARCDVYSNILQGGRLRPFADNTTGVYHTANGSGGVHSGCLAAAGGGPGAASKCMYVNESYPFIRTPTFAVQQMASIFDTQCNLAGQVYELSQGVSAMLQLDCIVGRGSPWHECFQYIDKCSQQQVTGIIAPFQQQYIDEVRTSSSLPHTMPQPPRLYYSFLEYCDSSRLSPPGQVTADSSTRATLGATG
jgi:hypothetical protein